MFKYLFLISLLFAIAAPSDARSSGVLPPSSVTSGQERVLCE